MLHAGPFALLKVNVRRKHTEYGVTEEHYAQLEHAFMTTLEEVHGPSWPEEERQAWAAFLAIFPAMAEEVYSDIVRPDRSNR